MTRRVIVAVCVVFASISGSVRAESSLPENLQECIDLGLRNSRALHSALMEIRYSRASLAESRARFFPAVTAGAAYARLSEEEPVRIALPPPSTETIALYQPIADSYTFSISLRQPLFTGLSLLSDLSRNRSLHASRLQAYARQKQELVFEIEQGYWQLFKTRQIVKVIEENLARVEAHHSEIEDFFSQGLVTSNEVLKVEMQRASTALLQIEAQAAVRLAQTRLNLKIGLPRETVLETREPLPPQHALPVDLDTLIDEAMEKRPDLSALNYQTESAMSALTQSRSGWFPNLYLTGNLSYAQPNLRIFPPRERFETTWEIGVVGTVDIGKWYTTPHQDEKARSRMEQAKNNVALLRERISLEVIQAYLALKNTSEAIGVANQYILQAEENYRIVRETFQSGLARNTELLDAELSLLEAKLKHTEASVDHELAWAQLKKALGGSTAPHESAAPGSPLKK
jgi:outer membrane protein TolC